MFDCRFIRRDVSDEDWRRNDFPDQNSRNGKECTELELKAASYNTTKNDAFKDHLKTSNYRLEKINSGDPQQWLRDVTRNKHVSI